MLIDEGEAQPLPAARAARDQLGAAVDVLADALAENSRLSTLVASLESDRDRLDLGVLQVEAAGQAGVLEGRLAGNRQRLTAYVVCVAYCEECTLSSLKIEVLLESPRSCLPPPSTTGSGGDGEFVDVPAARA